MDHEDKLITIDENEMAEFIQENLLRIGTVSNKDDIMNVLHFEMEFLRLKGVIKEGF